VKLVDLVMRPQLNIEMLANTLPAFGALLNELPADRRGEIIEAAEVLLTYKGYIDREQQIADKLQRLENIKIAGKFDYSTISALSTEARQKLTAIQPTTIAQASRIPGVSPADINILLLLLGR
jgi:tRNA uridine 5-carboxymethylaminomethyl modification enzyme